MIDLDPLYFNNYLNATIYNIDTLNKFFRNIWWNVRRKSIKCFLLGKIIIVRVIKIIIAETNIIVKRIIKWIVNSIKS